MDNLSEWLENKAKQKRVLYQQYGKPLEQTHQGEYLAIGTEGKTILKKRAGEVLQKAIADFGTGNFSLVRVGHSTLGKWLNLFG